MGLITETLRRLGYKVDPPMDQMKDSSEIKFKDGDVVILIKDYTNGCDATTITRMTVKSSNVVHGLESGTQVIVTTRYFDSKMQLNTGKFAQEHLELAPPETSGTVESIKYNPNKILVVDEAKYLPPETLKALGEAMDIPPQTRAIYLQAPRGRMPSGIEPNFEDGLAEIKATFHMPFTEHNELVFPAYSVVAYDPSPLRSLNVAEHGKLLLMMAKRSSHWEVKRLEHIAKWPFCAVCGFTMHLNVHHIEPFHVRPDLELVDINLLTLGEDCPTGNHHFLFGHFLNWKKANPNVAADATRFFAGISKPL